MRATITKAIILLLAAACISTVSVTVITCSDKDSPFDDGAEVTDPYCVNTPTWYEELTVTASYDNDDPTLLVTAFEPKNDIVDMNGVVEVEGADVDSLAFDAHGLWLVLLPYEDTEEVVIKGHVDCTTESRPFVVTLFLSPEDGVVTYEISYVDDESDAGVDGGDGTDE